MEKWLASRSGAGNVQYELRTSFHPKEKERKESMKLVHLQWFSDYGPGLSAPASCGHLERQIFRPQPRPTESESLGVAPVVCFLQVFLVALRPTGLKGTGDITVKCKTWRLSGC